MQKFCIFARQIQVIKRNRNMNDCLAWSRSSALCYAAMRSPFIRARWWTRRARISTTPLICTCSIRIWWRWGWSWRMRAPLGTPRQRLEDVAEMLRCSNAVALGGSQTAKWHGTGLPGLCLSSAWPVAWRRSHYWGFRSLFGPFWRHGDGETVGWT